jgi:uncharacterized membrane protein YbhN (UPF0104 family)
MKRAWHRWGWPLVKGLLVLAILWAIGRKFYDDLTDPRLATIALHPGWLLLSAALYLPGLVLSAWYWHHLLCVCGQRPRFITALRAYFMGHLGKFVPGKALAVVLRAGYVRGPNVRFGIAVITTFYEVFATMAAGGLVAAVIFAIDPPEVPGLDWEPRLTSLLLLGLCVVPLWPDVFNFIVGRMARRFEKVDSLQLPQLRFATLVLGLCVTAVGWLFLGLSVWALLQAVSETAVPWSFAVWMRCTGSIALAYVAGFMLGTPGGVGAREIFLLPLLGFACPQEAFVAAAVVLLRLVWTATEVATAGALLLIRNRTGPLPTSPGVSLQPPGMSAKGLEVTVSDP